MRYANLVRELRDLRKLLCGIGEKCSSLREKMEEMKEGLPEKLNHEIMKGEESLTGTGKGRRFHGD